jgi:hypothetical protein
MKTDGRRIRNTEIFGFEGDKISRVEVYFGWDVDRRLSASSARADSIVG